MSRGRSPEARRAARAAGRAAAGPAPTPAERTRATLAREPPRAASADLDALAVLLAERAAVEGFDLSTATTDLVAIWIGAETPEDRGDRHAAEDRERADRWWRSRLAADGIGIRSCAPRAEVDRPVFAARRRASANAAALRPRTEADRALAV